MGDIFYDGNTIPFGRGVDCDDYGVYRLTFEGPRGDGRRDRWHVVRRFEDGCGSEGDSVLSCPVNTSVYLPLTEGQRCRVGCEFANGSGGDRIDLTARFAVRSMPSTYSEGDELPLTGVAVCTSICNRQEVMEHHKWLAANKVPVYPPLSLRLCPIIDNSEG